MSDLIEKAAGMVRPHLYSEGGNSEVVARAAILAVLEYYSEAVNVSDVMLEALLAEKWVRQSIAAAMRAELERLRGEK